ncbi:MAG: TraR/DksA family transcriptional regulator [Proteobacteria bacterium]|jgi:RNA polymerase-binding protein DksA|nr:TraR/DksA family transcriptional regulator [Pseudomonadota bacterium]
MTDKMQIRQTLLRTRQEILGRVTAIDKDLRNEAAPLDRDSAEQAQQLENEEVLSALDMEGRQELVRIDRALKRLEDGSYGVCAQCGIEIPAARLAAIPYTDLCVNCAAEQGR